MVVLIDMRIEAKPRSGYIIKFMEVVRMTKIMRKTLVLAVLMALIMALSPEAAYADMAGDIGEMNESENGTEGGLQKEAREVGGSSEEGLEKEAREVGGGYIGGGEIMNSADEGGEASAPVNGEAVFSHVAGSVTLMDEWNGHKSFRVLDTDGGEADFTVDISDTVFSDLEKTTGYYDIAVGKSVDVYFVKPAVMTLQYPPRYTASVVVIRDEGNPGNAFVGVIDELGLASDGSIRLNIADDARVTLQSDGSVVDVANACDCLFANRIIIAYYTITTRSFPPIAPVSNVVILDRLGVPVFVNGMRLFSAEARVKADGSVMLPLRAIAEALGFEVSWDDDSKTARIGVATYVKIGSDEYVAGRMAPMKLEAAAELYKDHTYAPVSFYQLFMSMNYKNVNGLITLQGAPVKEAADN